MRKYFRSLALAPLLLVSGCTTFAPKEPRVESYSTLNAGEISGETYVVDATKEKIDTLPDWYFGAGEPQVSVGSAFRLAKEKLKEVTRKHESFTDVSLYMRTVSLGGETRVVYSFSFVEPDSVSSTEQGLHGEWTSPNQIQIWLGTDGTVFDTIKGPHEEIIY